MSLEDDLLDSAVRQLGLVPADRLDALRKRLQEESRPLRQALVEEGILSPGQMDIVLRVATSRKAEPAAPGATFGKYKILAELGRGAMGIVYRAEDTTLQREVALKILSAIGAHDETLLPRFEREARLAAQLRHPAIVTVYEAGVEKGFPFIAMQLVRGTTFDQILAEAEPRMDLRARVDLIRRVAEAVQSAHDQGIVHRDLKPSNILVDAKGAPFVADFGLAREMAGRGSLTGSGTTVGTPAYMAPEQASGDNAAIDERTDVFSLGVILYHALTHRRPFDDPSVMAIMRKVIEEEPVAPSRVVPGLDRDLETVCLKAMSKMKSDRYRTARALAEDLGRWLGGEPVKAHPPSTVRRLVRGMRRFSVIAISVFAVLLCAALAFLYAVTRPGQFAFEVDPADARVEIDGLAASSPVSLALGRHRVRVHREGLRAFEEDVDIRRGETVTRRYRLVPPSAALAVRPQPEGLRVRVRGAAFDREAESPWVDPGLKPGRYRIDLWGRGCSVMTLTVNLADGDDRTLEPHVPSAVVWQVETGKIDMDPVLADFDGDGRKDVAVIADNGDFWILSGAGGGRIMHHATKSPPASSPVLVDLDGNELPEVAVGLADGRVIVVDGKKRNVDLTLTLKSRAYPAASFGRLKSQLLLALWDGVLLRTEDTKSEMKQIWAINHVARAEHSPVIADVDGDGTAEILMISRTEFCVHELADGKSRIRVRLEGQPRSGLLASDLDGDGKPEVVLGLKNGSVVCINPREGSVLWTVRTGGEVRTRPAAGLGGVIVGSDDGYVYAIDKSGNVKWRFRTGGEVHAEPAIADIDGDGAPEVIVGSDDDHVHVLDGVTGQARWSFQCGEDVDGAIRLLDSDGDGLPEVVAASNDGKVYCLRVFAIR